MAAVFAWAYAGLTLVIVLFQVALALGQPWGRLTMGGRFPGVLPSTMRLAAVGQGLLLLALALVVLASAGQIPLFLPGWTVWGVVAITAVTTVLNLITPSAPERRLWGPIAIALLISVLIAAVLG